MNLAIWKFKILDVVTAVEHKGQLIYGIVSNRSFLLAEYSQHAIKLIIQYRSVWSIQLRQQDKVTGEEEGSKFKGLISQQERFSMVKN